MKATNEERVRRLVHHVFAREQLSCIRGVGLSLARPRPKLIVLIRADTTPSEMDDVTTLLAEFYSHVDPEAVDDEIRRKGAGKLAQGDVEWIISDDAKESGEAF